MPDTLIEEQNRLDAIEEELTKGLAKERPGWVLYKRCKQIASDFAVTISPANAVDLGVPANSIQITWKCEVSQKLYGGAIVYKPGERAFESQFRVLMIQAHETITRIYGLQPLNDTTTGAAPPNE